MSFNVGDVVSNCGTEYDVIETEFGETGGYRVRHRVTGLVVEGWYGRLFFTLVTPAGPPPSKLTGMTQFFKDHKEKTNDTA
jgi:hypothetical protein